MDTVDPLFIGKEGLVRLLLLPVSDADPSINEELAVAIVEDAWKNEIL